MNTRLQVEHPVAEAVTGLDLVALQIRIAQGAPPGIAQGAPPGIAQADFALSGHAIDARLHAEAPGRGGGPSAGPVALWRPPGAHRADAGIAAGGEVSARHDPMVAKPIARAPTREEARRRLIAALRGTAPIGPDSGAAFLIELFEASDFSAGRATADWLVARWPGRRAPRSCARAASFAGPAPRRGAARRAARARGA